MKVDPFLIDAVGMQQDYGRDEVPAGYVWALKDFNPHISGAALRMRGAWLYTSQDLGTTPAAGVWAPYSAAKKMIVVDVSGYIWDVPPAGPTATLLFDSSSTPATEQMYRQNPLFYRNKVYIPTMGDVARVLSYTGSFSLAELPASSFPGRHGAIFRERLALANNSGSNRERVAFAKPGDPTLAWDAISFIDSAAEVHGLYAMRSQLLVFHDAWVEQIRGTTPPDSTLSDPTGDMQLGIMWEGAGCFDGRSIQGWQGNVIFADERGVHITDGGIVRNMISQGGLDRLWRETFEAGTIGGLPGTVFGDHYLCTTHILAGNSFTWVCHIPTRRWWRWKNVETEFMLTVSTAPERIYASHRASRRVTNITTCMKPDNTVEQVDANGVAVLPEVETGWLRMSKRAGFRRLFDLLVYFLGYRTSDPGTDLVEISMVDTIEDTSYEVIGGLRQAAESDRRKLLVSRRVEGVALKIRALQQMRDFRIHDVGFTVDAEEEHRV